MTNASETKRKKEALIFLARRLSGTSQAIKRFNNRGQEIRRIETLGDAVFAFTISILIMALEVLVNYEMHYLIN